MVLGGRPPGRVGRRRIFPEKRPLRGPLLFASWVESRACRVENGVGWPGGAPGRSTPRSARMRRPSGANEAAAAGARTSGEPNEPSEPSEPNGVNPRSWGHRRRGSPSSGSRSPTPRSSPCEPRPARRWRGAARGRRANPNGNRRAPPTPPASSSPRAASLPAAPSPTEATSAPPSASSRRAPSTSSGPRPTTYVSGTPSPTSTNGRATPPRPANCSAGSSATSPTSPTPPNAWPPSTELPAADEGALRFPNLPPVGSLLAVLGQQPPTPQGDHQGGTVEGPQR